MKYAWIDQHRDRYSVSRLCRVLAVSRSGYCQWRGRGPSRRAQATTGWQSKSVKLLVPQKTKNEMLQEVRLYEQRKRERVDFPYELRTELRRDHLLDHHTPQPNHNLWPLPTGQRSRDTSARPEMALCTLAYQCTPPLY